MDKVIEWLDFEIDEPEDPIFSFDHSKTHTLRSRDYYEEELREILAYCKKYDADREARKIKQVLSTLSKK